MKFEKQPDTFSVSDALDTVSQALFADRSANDTATTLRHRHGPLLPDSIRCIISAPSNGGKTNLMFNLLINPNGLRYANVYVFSRSLEQPKYLLLSEIFKNIPEIGYFTFKDSKDVPQPEKACKNSIFVFDDVSCDDQQSMRAYFSQGRHKNIDSFYLTQTYARIPKHCLRDNSNLICIFKMDERNLKHIYLDHVNDDMSFNTFKEICSKCWDSDKYGFLMINKDCPLDKGRYRCGLDTFVTNI